MKAPVEVQPTGRQEFVLAAEARSIAHARARVLECAGPFVAEARLADLALVLSEVVTNAVRHGAEEGTILLAVTPKDDYLCVQVTDPGPGLAPVPRATAPDADGGWGFFLIESLTRRWGVTRENNHTRVWFEYDFDA